MNCEICHTFPCVCTANSIERSTWPDQPNYGFQPRDLPEAHVAPFSEVIKPYGYIKTYISTDLYCLKEIFMKAGGVSSLEYHINKTESYYIRSGTLKMQFRIGRANGYTLEYHAGESIDLVRGMMHRRIAVTDVLIWEVSTKDDNKDSNLVELGPTYKERK